MQRSITLQIGHHGGSQSVGYKGDFAMPKRRFELKDDKSQKFWEINQRGKKYTVGYGRIGTDGQTRTKEFDSSADAKFAAEKLIAEKTRKGYVEVDEGKAARSQRRANKGSTNTHSRSARSSAKGTSRKRSSRTAPAKMTPTDCRRMLDDPRLSAAKPQLEPLLRNAIRIFTSPAKREPPVGTSKIGGRPDLPNDFEWPTIQLALPKSGKKRERVLSGSLRYQPSEDGVMPIPFVAQINLQEVRSCDSDRVLPERGMLTFFCDPNTYPYRSRGKYVDAVSDLPMPPGAGENPRNWKVVYHEDASSLARRELPKLVPDSARFACLRVKFQQEMTLPTMDTPYLCFSRGYEDALVCLDDDSAMEYGDVRYDLRANIELHQMLGYSDQYATNADMASYFTWRQHLFPRLKPAGEIDRKARFREGRNIRLLLQLETLRWPTVTYFGRNGHLYFFIRENDLKARRFDRVWTWQD